MILKRHYTKEGTRPDAGLPFCIRMGEDGGSYRLPAAWTRAGLAVAEAEIFASADGDLGTLAEKAAAVLGVRLVARGLLTEEEAAVFKDEFSHILLHRYAMPETAWLAALAQDKKYAPRESISDFNNDPTAASAVKVPADAGRDISTRLKYMAAGAALAGGQLTVTIGAEHAACREIAGLQKKSDLRAVAEEAGLKLLRTAAQHVMDACDRDGLTGFDPDFNLGLARAIDDARAAGAPDAIIDLAISRARQGFEDTGIPQDAAEEDGNIRAVISLPDELVEAAITGHSLKIYQAGTVVSQANAGEIWENIADAIWSSGAPRLLFRGSAGDVAATGAGGLLSGVPAVAASGAVDIFAFLGPQGFDVAGLRHVACVMTLALTAMLEESAAPAVCLGMTNLSSAIMAEGFAYDSDGGRRLAALVTAHVAGAAHVTSAFCAERRGAIACAVTLDSVKEKRAIVGGTSRAVKGMTRRPLQLNLSLGDDDTLTTAVKDIWDEAYDLGRAHGFYHAHLTALPADRDIQALLGAQAGGIMPGGSIVRVEGYYAEDAAGADLYGKKINPAVPRALSRLGYDARQIDDIYTYATGHGTLFGAPVINHDSLTAKGMTDADLAAIDAAIKTAPHLSLAVTPWLLGGEEDEDILKSLGFTEDEIDAASLYACGAMTLEGAPHLNPDHLPVFDCVSPPAPGSIRFVSPEAQIKMQAAVEPFLSGAVQHTVALDHHAAIGDAALLMMKGWEWGLKTLALYRDSSSLKHGYILPALRRQPDAGSELPVRVAKKA